MEYKYLFWVTLIFSLIISAVLIKYFIPIMKEKSFGQHILEIGPSWHGKKEGTPTMAGVCFILVAMIEFVFFVFFAAKKISVRELMFALNVIVYSIINGMIGFVDDMAKIRKAVNEGLTPKTKFLFQSIAAILFLASLKYTVLLDTVLYIPFFDFSIDIGVWFYILAYFLLCGTVNSVNLTDGIDGLASSVTLTVGIFFCFVNFVFFRSQSFSFFSALIIGIMIAFLFFNLHPARVFMGDTGSLFLGAIIASLSFLMDNILLVVLYGAVFMIEALSDILQVGFFKISRGKRIFKMAPLHHHFEKCGWSEMKIVYVFTFANAIFCIIAYFGIN